MFSEFFRTEKLTELTQGKGTDPASIVNRTRTEFTKEGWLLSDFPFTKSYPLYISLVQCLPKIIKTRYTNLFLYVDYTCRNQM